jgi:hypothetical protein
LKKNLGEEDVDEEFEKEKKEEREKISKIISNLNNEDCHSKKQAMYSMLTNIQNINLLSYKNSTQTMNKIKFSTVIEKFEEEWIGFLKTEHSDIEWEFVRKVLFKKNK